MTKQYLKEIMAVMGIEVRGIKIAQEKRKELTPHGFTAVKCQCTATHAGEIYPLAIIQAVSKKAGKKEISEFMIQSMYSRIPRAILKAIANKHKYPGIGLDVSK